MSRAALDARAIGVPADRRAGGVRGVPAGPSLPAAVQMGLIWRFPFAYLERCRARYGARFTHRMTGFPPLVFLSDPSEVRELFGAAPEDLLAGEGAVTTRPIVGADSFMLKDGPEHLAVRRRVLSSLHEKAVEEQAGFIAELACRAVSAWPRNAPLALHPRLRALTLEIVLERVFGPLGRRAPEDRARLRHAILRMLDVTASPAFPEPVLRRGPGRRIWQRFLRDRAEVDELIYALIDRHLGSGASSDRDLLTVLSGRDEAGRRPSRQQLRDDVVSLVLAGHETTAAQLSWAFQLLAYNPAAMRRLVAEIDRDDGDEYLTAVVREVLRDRPVFLFAVPRVVRGEIEIGERTYDSSGQLLGCIYLVHHDPSLYSDPSAFRPERFLSSAPQPYAWVPWGGGRKRCPGSHMATLELKTVLRAVLSEHVVAPASKQIERPRWRSVIVAPHAGSRVVLEPRPRRSIRVPHAARSG